MSPVRIDRSNKPLIRRGQGTTARIAVPGTPGPNGPAGAPGGSDASFAGWVNDAASQTQAAIVGRIADRHGINVLNYAGIDPTGVADSTAAIQAAIDAAAASLSRKLVVVPSGTYSFTQIVMRYGVRLIGAGVGGFGPVGETYGSRLVQIPGTNKHGIVFNPGPAGVDGVFRTGAFEISHLELTGDPASAKCGIAARRPDDGTADANKPVMLIDLSRLHHLSFRNWGSHGLEIPGGGLPLDVHHIHGLYNGGALVYYSPGTFGGITEMVSFDQISGDGNIPGLIKIEGQAGMGPVHLTNIKSERRTNPNTSTTGQDSAVVFVNCEGLSVKVDSLSHQNSVITGGTRERPGPGIRIEGGSPRLEWSNVRVRVEAGAAGGGTPATVYDVAASLTVPINTPRGVLGSDEVANHVTVNGWFSGALQKVRRVIGHHTARGDAGILTAGQFIDGLTPGTALYESDAAADEKAWMVYASGGQFVIRTVSDAGGLGEQVMILDRVGNAVDFAQWQAHLVPLVNFGQSLGTDAIAWNQACVRDLRLRDNTMPAASAANRGSIRIVQGGAGVADQVAVCVKDAADAYSWKTLI